MASRCPLPSARRAQRAAPARAALLAAVSLAVIWPLGSPAIAQSNPCAALGPGFQKAPGSDSCVRAGGAVRVDAFSGGSLSANPGAGNTPTGTGAAAPAAAAPPPDKKTAPPPAAADPWRQTR